MFSYYIGKGPPPSNVSSLHPRVESDLQNDYGSFPEGVPPFYTEFTKHPSLPVRTYNDLLGNIELYKLEGLEKLERSFFYNMMDYAVNFVATNFVVASGDVLPKHEHCVMIFRTLIEYRDQPWHGATVRSIHAALDSLNDDMVKLLVEYYAFDKYLAKTITYKDFNLLILKHSFIAQSVGLIPADYMWGRFSPVGFEEFKFFNTWSTVRDDKIREEMVLEYVFCDIDVMMTYLESKIEENQRMYSHFMAQKFALEELDQKAAGIKELSYKDMVHYRTYAGDDFIYRYGFMRAYLNRCTLIHDNVIFFRELEAYRRNFDPDAHKDFYRELADRVEDEMARKREGHRNRFFYKK